MASIIKVDEIKEKTQGSGITLGHALKNSSGTEIMSAAGVFSSNINGGTISNATLASSVTFPAVPQFISAWARITATASGSETIADGYNFSAINRQAQGEYRMTFSASAPITNTNYMVMGQVVVGSTATAPLFVVLLNGDTKTTTEFDFYVSYATASIGTGKRDYSTWNEIHLFVIGGF